MHVLTKEYINRLCKMRSNLIRIDEDVFSPKVEVIEDEIISLTYLPPFEEVVQMISEGRMKSIFS